MGLLAQPRARPDSIACGVWLDKVFGQNVRIVVPEIIDYELRRELLRANKTAGLRRLSGLLEAVEYLPLSTAAMRLAAELWAQTRQRGRPTAVDAALDIDMILAAQARLIQDRDTTAVVATANVRHLSPFIMASEWQDIRFISGTTE